MGSLLRVLGRLYKANDARESGGALDEFKRDRKIPTDYRFVQEEVISAIRPLGLQYVRTPDDMISGGWVPPDIYRLAQLYFEQNGYSDMTLDEWFNKMYAP